MITDVYLKRTNKGGRVVITHHWAWDLQRFLASQQQQQRELAASGKDSVTITVATQEEYRNFQWPKKSTTEASK